MSNIKTKDGFIMDFWETIFKFLSRISLFEFIRFRYKNKIKKPYTFVEAWVVGNLIFALFSSIFIYLYPIENSIILWIILIYGISRVFEIIIYQINVILFDPYRAQKKNTQYKVKSVSRMLVLLIHNYFEIIFWYSAMIIIFKIFHNSSIDNSWLHYIKSSFLCISTFDGEAVVSNGAFLSKIAFFETASGIVLTIISIARCINLLPAVGEIDANEKTKNNNKRQ